MEAGSQIGFGSWYTEVNWRHQMEILKNLPRFWSSSKISSGSVLKGNSKAGEHLETVLITHMLEHGRTSKPFRLELEN